MNRPGNASGVFFNPLQGLRLVCLCELCAHKILILIFSLNALVASLCACVHVFMCVTLWHFLQWVFNGCVAMATPCLHAQSKGSFVRPLRKQAIRRHLHTHTHAHALKSTRTTRTPHYPGAQ